MTISAKEARGQEIFVIETKRGELVVESTNLYDFVMISMEELTTRDGVQGKYFVNEKEQDCSCYDEEDECFDSDCEKCLGHGFEIVYNAMSWNRGNRGAEILDTFDTEEEADDYIFDRVYKYDFSSDDQRSTTYYSTEEEAKEAIIKMLADDWGVDVDVVESILRKKEIVEQKRFEQRIERETKERERVEKLALIYSEMINKVEGESYKETCGRLSLAIGQRVESSVFHKAVKMIRE